MILLTRLNQASFYLNPDLIEHLEATPDTVITMTTGHRYVVREGTEEVVARVMEYRRKLTQLTLTAH
jgi:flagellar protein FlbD